MVWFVYLVQYSTAHYLKNYTPSGVYYCSIHANIIRCKPLPTLLILSSSLSLSDTLVVLYRMV